MKGKHLYLLGIIGIALNISERVILAFRTVSSRIALFPQMLNIAGSVMLLIFFITFVREHGNIPKLKSAGLFGLIGEAAAVVISIIGVVNSNFINLYVSDLNKHKELLYITSILQMIGFVLIIASSILLLLFFINLIQYINSKSILKTAAFLGLAAEGMVLLSRIANRSLYFMLPSISSRVEVADFLKAQNMVMNIIGFIVEILLIIFFIVFYKVQSSSEGILEFYGENQA